MTAQTILPANSVTGSYEVENSLRFNGGSTDFFTTTQTAVTAERKKFTISCWVKRSLLTSGNQTIASAGNGGGSEEFSIFFKTTDALEVYHHNGSAYEMRLITNMLFRDPSAWYNIVFVCDTANGTAALRQRLFVNGVELTDANSDFSTYDESPQNDNLPVNVDERFQIGSASWGNPGNGLGNGLNLFSGYIAEFYQTAGQANIATKFGEFDEDSGIWKPIDPSGLTFGTNGIRLEFKEAGTSANSSGLGADTSGNDNHLTVTNLTAVDQSTDTCTNNFATLNPLQPPVHSASNAMTLREGNLQLHGSTDGGPKFAGASTIGVSSGKWYAEFKSTISNNVYGMVGVDSNPGELARNDEWPGYYANSYGYHKDGEKYTGNSGSSYGNAWTNDTIGVALDLDNNKLYFSKNGTFQNSGDPTTGATGTGAISITAASSTTAGAYFFALGDKSTSYINPFDCNFGSPIHSISSGNADGDGFGNFEYAVPSGYFALCTKNLAEYG